MAGTSVLKLKVDDKEYNSSLKQAQQGLQHLGQALNNAGKSFTQVDKTVVDYVRSIGQMEAQSKTARGRINEMSNAFVEFSLQYKQMSEEVKKSDVGKALAESIDQLKQRTIDAKEELDELNKSLNNVKMPEINAGGGGLFAGLGDKMSGAIQVFAGNMMTKAAGAVAELGSEIFASVQQGIELAKQGEGIRIAFERLGRGDILEGLRQATHGTVTDLELMKAAVKFNDFKLPLDELGILLQFAQQKAKDTGQSVDYMVESITTGLGRKSLMILDNLGLSAAEIKEKMAETGDMTKAVGEIIREQMSKAGDYVETAAERAVRANVSLQNKMEELGRKFAPVEEASSQLWTSMKIGILDVIGGPLATLLNQLTEAGRLKNMLNNMNGAPGSGNTKVDQQLKKLNVIKKGGGSDYIFNSTLNGMMEDYNRQIMALDAQIKNGGKKPGAGSGESQDVRYLQQKMDALKIMRDQLAAGAKELNKPIKIESNIPDVTGGSGKGGGDKKGGGGKTEPTYAADSIAAQEKLVQDLNKAWREAGSGVRDSYLPQIVEAEAKLKTMKDEQTLLKEQAAGRLKGSPDNQGLEIPLTSDVAFDEWMGGVVEKLQNLEIDPIKIPIETTTKDVKSIAVAARMTADVVGSIGDAFNAIEDPAAKVMGTVMQAIASVALGYAQATAQAGSMGPWVWLAFAASGLATMIATISTIHSQTGYAEGGIVGGNSYSGDNIMANNGMIGLNSGELILNRAQQSSLAQQLEGGGMQNLRLEGVVTGENIHIVHNRYLKRSGQGELVTW